MKQGRMIMNRKENENKRQNTFITLPALVNAKLLMLIRMLGWSSP